jgi:hypothetical protein
VATSCSELSNTCKPGALSSMRSLELHLRPMATRSPDSSRQILPGPLGQACSPCPGASAMDCAGQAHPALAGSSFPHCDLPEAHKSFKDHCRVP